jgi:hypothetical protein
MEIFGGKWRVGIVHHLAAGPLRLIFLEPDSPAADPQCDEWWINGAHRKSAQPQEALGALLRSHRPAMQPQTVGRLSDLPKFDRAEHVFDRNQRRSITRPCAVSASGAGR